MGFRYAVVGAGRQGTAAAYDLVVRGDAEGVLILDASPAAVDTAVARLRALAGPAFGGHPPGIEGRVLDVAAADETDLARALEGRDALVSAVPYHLNLRVTRAAIRARAHACDFGGNTGVVRAQLALDAEAEAAGVSIVPDCGQAPGLANSLAVYAMGLLDEPRAVTYWDGGLPQNPRPPFHYALFFHIDGLLNEYWGEAEFLRGGRVVRVPVFSEVDTVEIPGLGTFEAFVTAGATSTCPATFQGRLETFENRTLRYPGHVAQFKVLHDLGLFSPEPLEGLGVSPRQVVARVLEPRIRARPGDRDWVIIYVRCAGRRGGVPAEARLLLVDRHDEATGFSAMERTTGWHGAMVAHLMARGETPRGARPVEVAVPPGPIVAGARARGMALSEEVVETSGEATGAG